VRRNQRLDHLTAVLPDPARWEGSPALAQLAGELAGQLKLVKVNVDEAPKLQQRFGVQAIPTLMVLRNGQVIARQAGAAPAPALRAWLEQALQR
jgi:thioredoxin 2